MTGKGTKRKRETDVQPIPIPQKSAICEPDRKILVAVDFGTTFSGLAWCQSRKPEVQQSINQWPDSGLDGLEGVSSDKVPTEISYDGHNYKWGFQIEDSVQRHQWFKLDLDPSQTRPTDLASQYHDPMKAPPTYDGGAEKLVTDYMTALRKHAEQVLRYKLPQSAMTSIPIEYIVTMPAVWSDMARNKTQACARAAGLGSNTIYISEPEAAALYALDALDPHGISVGDTFVLCDAGGGTVDLITYTVSALKPTLKLTEASPGSGSLCGASFLNQKFLEFLERKLKDQVGWDEDVLEEAMKRFEAVVKRQFRGTFGEEFIIPVPGLRDNKELGIRKNKMTVAGTEIRAVFEPVLDEVLRLVTGQIKASKTTVKNIILVGGFGQNSYLRDAIRQEVKASNIEVLQSPNSWTAVVRGALMKGLASTSSALVKVSVSGRSARKHYGLWIRIPFSEHKHDPARKVWDSCDGIFRIFKMRWFINKGAIVEEDTPIRLSYYQTRKVSEGPFTVVTSTVYFDSDLNNSGAAKYIDNIRVVKLVNVEADLSRIALFSIPRVKGADGKMYYKVNYDIQVTYYSAKTTYELIYQNVNYGLVSAEYV